MQFSLRKDMSKDNRFSVVIYWTQLMDQPLGSLRRQSHWYHATIISNLNYLVCCFALSGQVSFPFSPLNDLNLSLVGFHNFLFSLFKNLSQTHFLSSNLKNVRFHNFPRSKVFQYFGVVHLFVFTWISIEIVFFFFEW